MALDGGLIVGYLTAALLRGARQLADRGVEALLDKLVDTVAGRLGTRVLDKIESSPGDRATQQQVGGNLELALRNDPQFAQEVAALVAELDRRGARTLINQVNAEVNVQAFDRGIAIGGDFNYVDVPDPGDLSDSPGWVKACVVLGALLAVAAFGIFGYTLFTDQPDLGDPDFGETPAGIPIAAGVFFAGFIILGVGAIGRSMSRRD